MKVVKKIGEGGQGVVWLVQDHCDNLYAMKKVRCISFNDLNKSLEEVQNLLKITHPNVLRVHKFSLEQNTENKEFNLVIINEYCNSKNLKDLVRKFRKKKKKISVEQIIDVLTQVTQAVLEIHKNNIIHRDLKCENIFIHKKEDSTLLYKIGDFGFSKFFLKKTLTNTVLGSPLYIPPEIKQGKRYSEIVDIWGISCILLEMVLEKTFDYSLQLAIDKKEILGKIKENYPDEIVEFADKILQLEPKNRPNAEKLLLMIKDLKKSIGIKNEKDYNIHENNQFYKMEVQLKEKIISLQNQLSEKESPKMVFFKFSSVRKHEDIKISHSGFSCSNTSLSRGNRNVSLNNFLQKGNVYEWSIKYINHESFYNCMIGIANPEHLNFKTCKKSLGGSIDFSYGLFLRDGTIYHDRNGKEYIKDKIQSGDVINCKVDMIVGTISFKVNGKDYGVAFRNIPTQFTYVPAFTLYSSQEILTIMN